MAQVCQRLADGQDRLAGVARMQAPPPAAEQTPAVAGLGPYGRGWGYTIRGLVTEPVIFDCNRACATQSG